MRANTILATITAATVLTAGAFVAGGYLYEPNVAASSAEQSANSAEQNSDQGTDAQEMDGAEQSTSGGETVKELDFSTCETGGYRISTSGTLSPGDATVVEDCDRGMEQRVSGVRAYWTEGYENRAEYMNVEFSVTNEGDGMLNYEQDRFNLADEMGTTLASGELGRDYVLDDSPQLLAPGETRTWTVETEITPDNIGMPLVLSISPAMVPSPAIAVRYKFDVPEIPGYMQPVSPEHPANGNGATSMEDAEPSGFMEEMEEAIAG